MKTFQKNNICQTSNWKKPVWAEIYKKEYIAAFTNKTLAFILKPCVHAFLSYGSFKNIRQKFSG
jgi:hypothetical protein